PKPAPAQSPFDVWKLCIVSIVGLALPLAGTGQKTTPKNGVRQPAKSVESPAIRRWQTGLTLSQKVAQLVVIPFYGEAPNTRSRKYQRFIRLVRDYRVRGTVRVKPHIPR